jgi:hypothetical protein
MNKNLEKDKEKTKYSPGQIVKFKAGVFADKEMIGKIVATRTDLPDSYLIVWYEAHEAWKTPETIIEVCPIETLKEASKSDPALKELESLNHIKIS